MSYCVRVSTPCSLYTISAWICSNSRFSLATLFLAKLTSDFSKSGSYFVLPTLELEFTEKGQKTVRWFTSSKERYQKNWVVYADTYNLSLMTSIHLECHSNVHIHPLPAAVSVLWLKIFLSWPERLSCIYMYLKF